MVFPRGGSNKTIYTQSGQQPGCAFTKKLYFCFHSIIIINSLFQNPMDFKPSYMNWFVEDMLSFSHDMSDILSTCNISIIIRKLFVYCPKINLRHVYKKKINSGFQTSSEYLNMGVNVCLFLLRFNVPVNDFFSHVRMEPRLPGFKPELLGVYVSCSRTQHCAASGDQTQEFSILSPKLYHYATTLCRE